MTQHDPNRIPVLAGVGEVIDRPETLDIAREPAALMLDALVRAVRDTGSPSLALSMLDSLDIVAEYSWPYPDTCAVVIDRIGHTPRRCVLGEAGGESPVRLIHEAALRIAAGESTIAAVIGAEAQHSVAAALKQSVALPWSPRDQQPKLLRGKDICHPIAARHGMVQPVQVYPLYENAAIAAWGQTPAQAQDESAQLWSRYSHIAADNPYAWLPQRLTPDEIAKPGPTNRLIAWPYPKHMVANPFVNQGAAVLLMPLSKARELGIDERRLVYVVGGASANESRDYLQRDRYDRSTAQHAVLQAALQMANGDARRFGALELYSCFPIVPKLALRNLGLDHRTTPTCTGGLSFFGAPLNNYMTHAAASMVRRLRGRGDELGLLYGQGEYVTKHHALVLSSTPHTRSHLEHDYSAQSAADRDRSPAPAFLEQYAGSATLETYTIIYDRHGEPEFGTVIARTPQQQRLMARVRANDVSTLGVLTSESVTPVGLTGRVTPGSDDLLHWTFT